MFEMFKYQFMQNALMAGLIIGILCSVLSVFVVLKKMSFIGQGISHAAFGGIAFALLFELDIYLTAGIFCVIIAVLIGITSRKGKVSEDSSIGLFLTTSMALGVIFLNLKKGYSQEAFGYLFGNILAVTRKDVLIAAIIGAAILALTIYYFKKLQFMTFDEESAEVSGVPVTRLYFTLLIMLAITIVISVQMVGVILVSALLIIPATVALLIGKRFLQVTLISVGVGIFSVVSGLTISGTVRGLSSGAAIVVTLFVVFLVTFGIRKIIEKKNA